MDFSPINRTELEERFPFPNFRTYNNKNVSCSVFNDLLKEISSYYFNNPYNLIERDFNFPFWLLQKYSDNYPYFENFLSLSTVARIWIFLFWLRVGLPSVHPSWSHGEHKHWNLDSILFPLVNFPRFLTTSLMLIISIPIH